MSEALILDVAVYRGRLPETYKYEARLDGEVIAISDAPLFASARELMRRGYAPETLLTMRWQGKAPSFIPQPLSEWAKWAATGEGKNGRYLRLVHFQEFPSEGPAHVLGGGENRVAP